MENTPLVSIVIPAYNAGSYISRTLESVLAQSFRDYEVIVVDDCSKDSTAAIVERLALLDSRLKLLRLTVNSGAPAGPRNMGVAAAKGVWIAFLDADDLWHPAKLERQLAALDATGAQFCSTQMRNFVDERHLFLEDAGSEDFEWITFWKQLIKFRTPTSSVIVKKDLICRYPFNESLSFKAREDLDCWLHCHEDLGRSIKLTKPMMGYRIVPGQISGQKSRMFFRHLHVLRQYRFKSGRQLGGSAVIFTLSHFLFAMYYRLLRRGL